MLLVHGATWCGRALAMRVMVVVWILWSCGTEKCLFGFLYMCVRFHAEERTRVWRNRRRASRPLSGAVGRSRDTQTPYGVVGRSREKAQILSEVAGRSLPALLVRLLPCAKRGERE